jgi:hypothetical protein
MTHPFPLSVGGGLSAVLSFGPNDLDTLVPQFATPDDLGNWTTTLTVPAGTGAGVYSLS